MQELVEKLEGQRRSVLFWFVVTFAVWQLGTLGQEMLGTGAHRWLVRAIGGVTVVGAIGWIICLLRLQLFARRLRANPRAAHAVLDERFQNLRRHSFVAGYWALLGYLVVAAIVSWFLQAPAEAVVTGGILVAVVAPLISILWQDRGDADA